MDANKFSQVLRYTLSPEAGPRKEAETIIEQLIERADVFCGLLIGALTSTPEPELRQQSCILFRRFAYSLTDPEKSFWINIQQETQTATKNQLLAALTTEADDRVRSAVRDVIVSLTMNMMAQYEDEQQEVGAVQQPHFWPELLQALWTCASAAEPAHRESALLILSEVPSVFGDMIQRYLTQIQQLLHASLYDEANPKVQIAAIKAMAGFVTSLPEKEYVGYFSSLTSVALQVIMQTCARQDELQAQAALESFIDLAQAHPMFFYSNIAQLVEVMLTIGCSEDLEDGTRRLAIELLLVMCEQKAQVMRKSPDVVKKLIPLFMNFCTEIDDVEGWSQIDDDETGDEDSNATFGEQSLDRLALAMGGSCVWGVCFECLKVMIADDAWERRAAALTAIAAVAEGCLEQMRPLLSMIVDAVTPRLIDPHPRVRFMACNAIGQLSIDYAAPAGKENRDTSFQAMFHKQIIPTLLQMMTDSENPRVQAHGAAALVNFCEHASKETLANYLDGILTRLMELLQSPSRIVLEQTVTALATVADSSKDFFQKYYPHFMPPLKHILAQPPVDARFRLLRGKTMECITLIGIAVKKEMFAPDVHEIMHSLQNPPITDPDDPQISYVLAAWARICEILQEDFVPYLGVVMPPLLKSVAIKAEVKLLEVDAGTDELEGGVDNWELIYAGEHVMGIKTSPLEEKKTACEMLRIYVQQMQGAFGPYIEQVSELMIEALSFPFDEDVRRVSASILPLLMQAAIESPAHGPRACQILWVKFSTSLLAAIKSEKEQETLSWQLDALKDCVEILGTDGLSEQFLKELTDILQEHFKRYDERCDERCKARVEDPDYDADFENALEEDEQLEAQMIQEVANLIHALFNVLGKVYLPFFECIIGEFFKMLEPEPARTHYDHHWAICVFDDLIEACGPASFVYAPQFAQYMLRYLMDSHPEVRQAAAYGVGIMATHGGPSYAPICKDALAVLMQIVQAEDSRSHENIEATENAISAVWKIVCLREVGVVFEEALPQIINWLPIRRDEEEAFYVYGAICDQIQAKSPAIMREDLLLKIFTVFAEVGGSEVAKFDSIIWEKMKTTMIKLGDSANTILAKMDPKVAEELMSYLA